MLPALEAQSCTCNPGKNPEPHPIAGVPERSADSARGAGAAVIVVDASAMLDLLRFAH